MYKAIISYQWGRGRRIRSVHYSRTILGARLKAWYELMFHNKEFYNVDILDADE